MIGLAQLQHQLGNDLRPVAGHHVSGRQVTGVHISELPDPTPYLEGGELLLTTGIPLAAGAAATQRYVRRLAGKDVAALGLGLGAGVDHVPEHLLDACAAEGLELLVVPAGTPFMNVSRAYWDLVAKAGQADLASSLGTQTALARAASQPDALPSVIKALAQALGGWAAYLPSGDLPATLWPDSSRGVLEPLQKQARRPDVEGAPSASTFTIYGTDVVEYPVLVGRRTAGFLAIGAGRTLTRADRQVILTVCVLIALKAQQQQEIDATTAALGAAVAKLFLTGHGEAGHVLAADLGLPVPRGLVRVLVVRGGLDARVTLDFLAHEQAAAAGRTPGWPGLLPAVRQCGLHYAAAGLDYYLLDADPRDDGGARPAAGGWRNGVMDDDGAAPAAAGPAAAVGRPVPLGRVSDESGRLASLVRAADGGLLEVGGEVLDPRTPDWLAALRGYSRADLVGTVRSYLRHRGQWEGAARELGIHRNSLRHRMGIATDLLQADPDDPDVAANLWLALRWE